MNPSPMMSPSLNSILALLRPQSTSSSKPSVSRETDEEPSSPSTSPSFDCGAVLRRLDSCRPSYTPRPRFYGKNNISVRRGRKGCHLYTTTYHFDIPSLAIFHVLDVDARRIGLGTFEKRPVTCFELGEKGLYPAENCQKELRCVNRRS
jgi:hypothetical protein